MLLVIIIKSLQWHMQAVFCYLNSQSFCVNIIQHLRLHYSPVHVRKKLVARFSDLSLASISDSQRGN